MKKDGLMARGKGVGSYLRHRRSLLPESYLGKRGLPESFSNLNRRGEI